MINAAFNAAIAVANYVGETASRRAFDAGYWHEHWRALPPLTDLSSATDILLLAPHPNDEVLACSSVLQRNAYNTKLEMWIVTNGEACFGTLPRLFNWPTLRRFANVGARRQQEALAAHARLGLDDDTRVTWLSFPDGAVHQYEDELYASLHQRVTRNTVLVAPLPMDGYPDHHVVGRVARSIAKDRQLLLLSYPLSLQYWRDLHTVRTAPGAAHAVALSALEQFKKREAIAALKSQIYPLHGKALLSRRALRDFRRPIEVFFREDWRHRTYAFDCVA
jgi:LmbE family N-acetylglucosaminyl deacetylase